jgi:hypothetical protein
LALEYLSIVGRDKIWGAPNDAARNKERVEPTDEYFDNWCHAYKKMQFADYISSRNERAFVERACKWYFVEQIAGEIVDDRPLLETVQKP